MSYSIGWVTGRTSGLQQHLSPANLKCSLSEDQYGTQPNIRENNPAKQKPKVVNSRIEHGRRAGQTCTVNRFSQLRVKDVDILMYIKMSTSLDLHVQL